MRAVPLPAQGCSKVPGPLESLGQSLRGAALALGAGVLAAGGVGFADDAGAADLFADAAAEPAPPSSEEQPPIARESAERRTNTPGESRMHAKLPESFGEAQASADSERSVWRTATPASA